MSRLEDDLAGRLDAGVTLPFSWFADPAIFKAEQGRIFANTWQYAVPTAWVAEPGEYATCHAGLAADRLPACQRSYWSKYSWA